MLHGRHSHAAPAARWSIAVLLFFALVTPLVAPSPAEAAPRGRCAVKGSGTLARTSAVRVYRAPRLTGTVHAGNNRANRRFALGEGDTAPCSSDKTYEVRVIDSRSYGRHRVLDSGATIGPESLSRRGGTLRWRNGGRAVARALR